MSSKIESFTGAHAFLSNFFREPDMTTVEHEFQAAKTWSLRDKIWILGQPTPGKAKRAGSKKGLQGRYIELRSDWEQKQANAQPTKVNVMRDLVFRKFWDHESLAERLAHTGEAELIEGNHHHDNTWGDCRCSDCQDIEGENLLGITLMEVKALLL